MIWDFSLLLWQWLLTEKDRTRGDGRVSITGVAFSKGDESKWTSKQGSYWDEGVSFPCLRTTPFHFALEYHVPCKKSSRVVLNKPQHAGSTPKGNGPPGRIAVYYYCSACRLNLPIQDHSSTSSHISTLIFTGEPPLPHSQYLWFEWLVSQLLDLIVGLTLKTGPLEYVVTWP